MDKLQRRFGAKIVGWFREAVAEEGCSRSSLAEGLCEIANWCNAKGKLCLASARRALPALAADLGVALPAPQASPRAPRAGPPDSEPVPDPRIEAPLEDLGEVRLENSSCVPIVLQFRSGMSSPGFAFDAPRVRFGA